MDMILIDSQAQTAGIYDNYCNSQPKHYTSTMQDMNNVDTTHGFNHSWIPNHGQDNHTINQFWKCSGQTYPSWSQ